MKTRLERTLTILCGLGMLLAGVSVSGCSSGLLRKELVFTRADLQTKVEKGFPVEKKKRLVKVGLSNPAIVLDAGSERIGMRLDVAASLPGMGTVNGVVEADGHLVYRSDAGEIAITDTQLRRLEIADVPAAYRKTVKAIVATLTAKYLSDVTVYTLNPEEFKESLAKLLLRSVAVEDGRVIVEVGF